jgi:hypothetical protein
MKQTIRYRKKTIKLDIPMPIRDHICKCCGRQGKTDLHHWVYAYPTKQVQKTKMLALENTTELCFVCHRLANCISHLDHNPVLRDKLLELRYNIIINPEDFID